MHDGEMKNADGAAMMRSTDFALKVAGKITGIKMSIEFSRKNIIGKRSSRY
jgi:hypothetical protein